LIAKVAGTITGITNRLLMSISVKIVTISPQTARNFCLTFKYKFIVPPLLCT
jgi:hypothetical protein